VRKGGRNELRGQRAWVTIQDEERRYSSTQVLCYGALHDERLTCRCEVDEEGSKLRRVFAPTRARETQL
jgi:hypothetical protein